MFLPILSLISSLLLFQTILMNMPKVQRHQDIYSALSDVMNKIHALSIQAFTLMNMKKIPVILESPDCSKK